MKKDVKRNYALVISASIGLVIILAGVFFFYGSEMFLSPGLPNSRIDMIIRPKTCWERLEPNVGGGECSAVYFCCATYHCNPCCVQSLQCIGVGGIPYPPGEVPPGDQNENGQCDCSEECIADGVEWWNTNCAAYDLPEVIAECAEIDCVGTAIA
jgi:hypothetical protein